MQTLKRANKSTISSVILQFSTGDGKETSKKLRNRRFLTDLHTFVGCRLACENRDPFLLALRRWGRFARTKGNVPGREERGETDVFAG